MVRRIFLSTYATVFFLSLLLSSGCSITTESNPPTLASIEVSLVRDYVNEATHLAQQWQDDVKIIEVKAQIYGPLDTGYPKIDFHFESPKIDHKMYSITCFLGSCQGQEFAMEGTWLSGGWQPIEFDDKMITNREAVIIAQQQGGEYFLHSQTATNWVRLGRDNPRYTGAVVWLVFFGDHLERIQLRVVIDPYTGEVIRIE